MLLVQFPPLLPLDPWDALNCSIAVYFILDSDAYSNISHVNDSALQHHSSFHRLKKPEMKHLFEAKLMPQLDLPLLALREDSIKVKSHNRMVLKCSFDRHAEWFQAQKKLLWCFKKTEVLWKNCGWIQKHKGRRNRHWFPLHHIADTKSSCMLIRRGTDLAVRFTTSPADLPSLAGLMHRYKTSQAL